MKSYVPNRSVSNDELSKTMDTNDEWIFKRTGIKSRNWTEESIEQMAEKLMAQVANKNVDAIIVTSMSVLNGAPTLSSRCAKLLDNSECMCIDINAACSGFVYGLELAEGLLATGFKQVLIVSIEKMSSIIDKTDRQTAILFGDGGGAVVVSDEGNKLRFKYNQTIPDDHSLCLNDNQFLKMDGKSVFRFATNAVADVLNEYGCLDDVDWFVFHQANRRIIDNVVRKYNIDPRKVIINIGKLANTSSASIPLALKEVELASGDKVMMIGFGAGLSVGSVVYEH